MLEDEQEQPEAPRRPSALRRAAVATALVAGVMAGGYGIAAAQTDETPSTQDTPSTTAADDGTQQQAPDGTRPDRQGCDRGQDGTTGSTDSGSSSSSSDSSADATSL